MNSIFKLHSYYFIVRDPGLMSVNSLGMIQPQDILVKYENTNLFS